MVLIVTYLKLITFTNRKISLIHVYSKPLSVKSPSPPSILKEANRWSPEVVDTQQINVCVKRRRFLTFLRYYLF